MSSFHCEGSDDNSTWTNLYSKSGVTESDWVRDATNNYSLSVTDNQAHTFPDDLVASNI